MRLLFALENWAGRFLVDLPPDINSDVLTIQPDSLAGLGYRRRKDVGDHLKPPTIAKLNQLGPPVGANDRPEPGTLVFYQHEVRTVALGEGHLADLPERLRLIDIMPFRLATEFLVHHVRYSLEYPDRGGYDRTDDSNNHSEKRHFLSPPIVDVLTLAWVWAQFSVTGHSSRYSLFCQELCVIIRYLGIIIRLFGYLLSNY